MSPPKKIVLDFTLFDDESTRKKFQVMNKIDVLSDDARNPGFEDVEDLLEWGKTYRVTVEEISEPISTE